MKSIRLIIVMAVLLVGTFTARAAFDFPAVPTFSPGRTEALTVGATLPSDAVAIQFTMTLPDGFILDSTTLKLENMCSDEHIYRLNKISESSYKCVIYSNSNTPFISVSGNLFTLSLKADPAVIKGDYTLSFSEIRYSDASGAETAIPDAAVCLEVVIPAISVSITPSPVNILVGDELKLTAAVLPSDASQTVAWSSSDPSKVTVTDDGTVTGIAAGSATITAVTVDGTDLSASCTVSVSPVYVSSIIISHANLAMHPGETEALTVTVLPENAGNRAVEWSTSNASVVTVSPEGVVEAKSVGTAVVTAAATDGSGVTTTCSIAVTEHLAESISLSHEKLELNDGETATLKAVIIPAEASQLAKWSTSDPSKVIVSDEGVVTAVSPGSATVTATTIDGTDLSASCSVTVIAVPVESIAIKPDNLELHKGESETLIATVLPENVSNRTIKWSTSKATVVTVSQDGRVEAVGVGTAVVSATSTDGSGITSICTVTVKAPLAESISLDRNKLEINVGQSSTLMATILPSDASQTVAWSSSDPSKVLVSDDGTVTGIAAGSATITAATVDGTDLSADCRVTVSPVLVSSIIISHANLAMHPGETEALTVTVLPENAGNRAVEWSTSNASVVSVTPEGVVEAKSVGTAVVTAAATDGSGVTTTCSIAVTEHLAESISLSYEKLELNDGETATLRAVIIPAEASQLAKWSTSDPSKVIVSDEGVVTAVSPGSAIVTASTIDGTDLSATCSVTVSAVPVESIAITPENLELHKGESETLIATVLPENASNRTIKWSTSKASVVTVSQDGRVEAVGVGSAVVSATSTDGSGITSICTVTVKAPLAESIVLNHVALELKEGETAALKASISPADALQNVEWSSSNPTVASVDENGKVSAYRAGNSVITAKTKDDSGLTASCDVVVEAESGIDDIEGAVHPEVSVSGSEIIVAGVPEGVVIRVVTPSGSMVYRGTGRRIGGLVPGIYIVVVGSDVCRMVVR